jgi:hypothetical protein
VPERVVETVPRCLDEPLPVARPVRAERKSTKKTLYKNRHPPSMVPQTDEMKRERERSGNMSLEVMDERCAGIDVHQRFVVVCLLVVEGGKRRQVIRTFRNAHSRPAGLTCLAPARRMHPCGDGKDGRVTSCRSIAAWRGSLNWWWPTPSLSKP